jgi:hypothetical protein
MIVKFIILLHNDTGLNRMIGMSLSANIKLSFSGHDSFQCRQQWLKKGYDYILQGKSFNDEDSVVSLGVGKNMVSAIRYWMKAFDLLDNDDQLTSFAHGMFANDGWDPYLEDEASLWLLHYHLVKKGTASSYRLIFNELRREKIEFTKSNFIALVKRKAEGTGFIINEKTIGEDFGVLLKMYLRTEAQLKHQEDSFSGIFAELNLVHHKGKRGEDVFAVENSDKDDIPEEIILYTILDNQNLDHSVSLTTIEQDPGQAGTVFAISKTGITNKVQNIAKKFPAVTFSDHAGIRELQFKSKPDPFQILTDYYAN